MKIIHQTLKTMDLDFSEKIKVMQQLMCLNFQKENSRKMKESVFESEASTLKNTKLIIHSKINKNLYKS